MTSAFDDRIIRVGIEINGVITYFEGLDIRARGRKFLSPIASQCEIKITNLTREQRNYIITKASPMYSPRGSRSTVKVSLEVGRKSYGTFLLYIGECFSTGMSQPPDIGVILQSLTQNLEMGLIDAYSQSGPRSLRTICQAVADSFNPPLTLEFHATDKTIDNYSFTGAATNQVYKLNQMGGIHAAIDNGKLLVLDAGVPKPGAPRLINMNTGMVGLPQVTESGVYVKMLVDNSIQLGGSVQIESQINPAANGVYEVVQIGFDIANRDKQFYYDLFCSNTKFIQGTV